jgi:hypothetical protein
MEKLGVIDSLEGYALVHRLLRSSSSWATINAEVWISIWARYATPVQIAMGIEN